MPNVSYAQNREDILLARALPADAGFYVDVGAADPVEYSVTKHFYERGWSGVNVEPQDDYFAKLAADRPRDTNLQLVVSSAAGTLTLYAAPTHPGWATASEAVALQMMEQGIQVFPREIRAITLADLCAEHVPGEIDFLKVDVEGEERNVLLGGDFTRWRPRIVVVEATEQGSATPNHELWEDVILGRGYLFAAFDGLNRYYVRAEDEALIPVLRVPVNIFDDVLVYEHEARIWAAQADAADQRRAAETFANEAAALRGQVAQLLRERDDSWRESERLRAELAALAGDFEAFRRANSESIARMAATRERLGALRDQLARPRPTRRPIRR
jgi:FkbM family methyltransferase